MKVAIPLVVAIVLGVVAAIVASRMVSSGPQIVQSDAGLVPVIVAARPLNPGDKIASTDFKLTKTTPETVPGMAVMNPETLVGRVTRIQVLAGQTLIEPMLAPEGAAGGLQGLIKPGMRAITIGINTESGVGGFLEPGARIDLVCRMTDVRQGSQSSQTIAQNVEILAVGQRLTAGPVVADPNQPPQGPPNNVTLLVSPQQAELIDLAAAGQMRLVLRSATDGEVAAVSGATQSDLREAAASFARRNPSDQSDEPVEAASVTGTDPFAPITPANADPREGGNTNRPEARVRSVTIIRNGVESTVSLRDANTSRPDPGEFSGGNDLLEPVEP